MTAIAMPHLHVRRYQMLASLQVLDVLTTWIILSRFTERAEGNPIVATLIRHGGLELAMLSLLAVKLLVVFALYRKQTGVKLMSAIYSAVIVNNVLALALSLTS